MANETIPEMYDEDYFLHGKETGKSLYDNYRWMPELTIPMVETIVQHCGMEKGARVLDFGCARGYIVKALRGLGFDAFGIDASKWAVENADPEVINYIGHGEFPLVADWIIAKDVLEHVRGVERVVDEIMGAARIGVFVVVPLSSVRHGPYVIREYEKDITHLHRLPMGTWFSMFMRSGWSVEARYRLHGVKCNYYKQGWELGNAFITCRRVES